MDRGEGESIDSNPGSFKHFLSPPPIYGPPEIHAYTSSKEEEEGNNIAALREQLTTLKLRLNNKDDRVAEFEIDRMDPNDRMDTLHKAVCSKIKCLAKATGNEDLYRALNLRD